MPVSMYQATVPPYIKALTNLKAFLQKAATHAQEKKVEEAVLLQSRLYPDMFPLVTQVQIASDIARATSARLAGLEPPSYEDKEKTFGELYERIDRTLDYLRGLKPEQFEGADTRPITRPVRGQPHTFTGINYLQQFGIPNVYFHAATAYDILRHNGVELGKADFLGNFD
jgi:uncharacterized protein